MSPDESRPTRAVDVRKIQFPIAIVAALGLAVVSAAIAWAHTEDHVRSTILHLDPNKVIEGGGVAYKNDVAGLRNDIKWEFVNQARGMRKMLRATAFTCIRWRGGSCAGWKLEPPPEETP